MPETPEQLPQDRPDERDRPERDRPGVKPDQELPHPHPPGGKPQPEPKRR